MATPKDINAMHCDIIAQINELRAVTEAHLSQVEKDVNSVFDLVAIAKNKSGVVDDSCVEELRQLKHGMDARLAKITGSMVGQSNLAISHAEQVHEDLVTAVAKQSRDGQLATELKSEDIARIKGYEGAQLLLVNHRYELLFLLSTNKKTGAPEAEVAGGKPELCDEGPIYTAIRELKEEAGVEIADGVVRVARTLKTTGGNTGLPSIQMVTRPILEDCIKVTPREKFTGYCWSRVMYVESEKKWCLANEERTPIRKFNTFFLQQHMDDGLKQLIDVVTNLENGS
jgi:8-oxo-dGTP pyrophosphatase MutT (NUDIX family)